MSTAFEAFFPEVLPHVKGCATIVAANAIRNTVIDFCEKTRIWRETLPGITVLVDVKSYAISPPANTRIIEVVSAAIDGAPIDPASANDMDRDQPGWRETGAAQSYTMEDAETLLLSSKPAASTGTGLVLRVALKPTRAASECADVLFEDWLPQIAAGALFRLMTTRDQPYTDPAAAALNKAIYDAGINEALDRARQGHARVPAFVRPPRTI